MTKRDVTAALAFFSIGLLSGESSFAHGDSHALAASWWKNWTSPHVAICLTVFTAIYLRGWRRMGVSEGLRKRIGRTEALAFIGGMLSLVLALNSPIDAYSDVLQSVHMVQHMLIMMIAAPLFALASPTSVSLWGLPKFLTRIFSAILNRLRSFAKSLTPLTRSGLVWVLYGVILWIWHWPFLYEAALASPTFHDFQHLTFFFVSYLFWKVLFNPYTERVLQPMAGVMYLFVASLHSMVLGVLMTVSPFAWYEPYMTSAPTFGLTPLEDQQIAGLIMWMPAGTSYFVAAIYLIWRLLNSEGVARVEKSDSLDDSSHRKESCSISTLGQ